MLRYRPAANAPAPYACKRWPANQQNSFFATGVTGSWGLCCGVLARGRRGRTAPLRHQARFPVRVPRAYCHHCNVLLRNEVHLPNDERFGWSREKFAAAPVAAGANPGKHQRYRRHWHLDPGAGHHFAKFGHFTRARALFCGNPAFDELRPQSTWVGGDTGPMRTNAQAAAVASATRPCAPNARRPSAPGSLRH